MLRINPVGHGNNNNVYCTAKRYGVRMKLVMFFETGDAYIFNVRKKNPESVIDWDLLYKETQEAVDDMDFELKTPRKGFTKLNMNPEQFKNHLKEKYNNENSRHKIS
jgi:hypothetical protein